MWNNVNDLSNYVNISWESRAHVTIKPLEQSQRTMLANKAPFFTLETFTLIWCEHLNSTTCITSNEWHHKICSILLSKASQFSSNHTQLLNTTNPRSEKWGSKLITKSGNENKAVCAILTRPDQRERERESRHGLKAWKGYRWWLLSSHGCFFSSGCFNESDIRPLQNYNKGRPKKITPGCKTWEVNFSHNGGDSFKRVMMFTSIDLAGGF